MPYMPKITYDENLKVWSGPERSNYFPWDAVNGDEAAASVVKRHSTILCAHDVLGFVNEHIKAKYKQLNAGVIIVDDLKRCGNGKTNRRANKDHFLKLKNLKDHK